MKKTIIPKASGWNNLYGHNIKQKPNTHNTLLASIRILRSQHDHPIYKSNWQCDEPMKHKPYAELNYCNRNKQK